MTPTEIRAYQTSFPLRFATNQMRYVPRCYRESNVPYEGVKNPIPLERMKDPETGDFYGSKFFSRLFGGLFGILEIFETRTWN